jgi:hypothetical protein
MIITQANISMAARHQYQEKHEVTERLEFWLGGRNSADESVSTEAVTISRQAFALSAESVSIGPQKLDLEQKLDARSRINLMILMAMYRAITGRNMQLTTPAELNVEARGQDSRSPGLPTTIIVDVASPASASAGGGLIYERHERYHETEKMQFQAAGVVKTADGRTIDFSAHLSMSREYYEESSLIVRAGDAVSIDPLVINFDGLGAQLSQTRFAFDLDSDGTPDQIAMLRPGSGMLVLDRNGDGVVNDGSELFGPTTGQGFAELARFDEDGNRFIDAGDSIYHKLRIWTMNEDGTSQLVALGDKNIGAIFLGHVSTPFQLKDNNNQSLGDVVRSGIYLSESGQVGVVQEINLTV